MFLFVLYVFVCLFVCVCVFYKIIIKRKLKKRKKRNGKLSFHPPLEGKENEVLHFFLIVANVSVML